MKYPVPPPAKVANPANFTTHEKGKGTCDSFGSNTERYISENIFDMDVDRSIFEFNEKLDSDYIMKDIPAGFTHRTLELEEQFTEAANCGDVERFRELLRQWRGAWLGLMVKRPVTYH